MRAVNQETRFWSSKIKSSKIEAGGDDLSRSICTSVAETTAWSSLDGMRAIERDAAIKQIRIHTRSVLHSERVRIFCSPTDHWESARGILRWIVVKNCHSDWRRANNFIDEWNFDVFIGLGLRAQFFIPPPQRASAFEKSHRPNKRELLSVHKFPNCGCFLFHSCECSPAVDQFTRYGPQEASALMKDSPGVASLAKRALFN